MLSIDTGTLLLESNMMILKPVEFSAIKDKTADMTSNLYHLHELRRHVFLFSRNSISSTIMMHKFDRFQEITGTPVLVCILDTLHYWMMRDTIIFHHSLWLMINLLKMIRIKFDNIVPLMRLSDTNLDNIKTLFKIITQSIMTSPQDTLFRYDAYNGVVMSASADVLKWCRELESILAV